MADTGAVLYVPFRAVSGLFSATVTAPPDKKRWRPSSDVPFTDENHNITRPWAEFMDFLADKKIGGPNATPLPQVEATISVAEAQAILASLVTQAVSHMATTNAQALSAVVQSVQAGALPGASQIPPVQLQPTDYSAGGE